MLSSPKSCSQFMTHMTHAKAFGVRCCGVGQGIRGLFLFRILFHSGLGCSGLSLGYWGLGLCFWFPSQSWQGSPTVFQGGTGAPPPPNQPRPFSLFFVCVAADPVLSTARPGGFGQFSTRSCEGLPWVMGGGCWPSNRWGSWLTTPPSPQVSGPKAFVAFAHPRRKQNIAQSDVYRHVHPGSYRLRVMCK